MIQNVKNKICKLSVINELYIVGSINKHAITVQIGRVNTWYVIIINVVYCE